MTIREAAGRANVTDMTVRRWIKTGKLKAEKQGPKGAEVYFIAPEDLESLLGESGRAEFNLEELARSESSAVLAERVAGLEAMLSLLSGQVEEKDALIRALTNSNALLNQQNAELQTLALPKRKEPEKVGFWAKVRGRSKEPS